MKSSFAWVLKLMHSAARKGGSPIHVDTWICAQSQECIEAHTNVDIVVNLNEFEALLASRLPLVFNGTPVSDAALPWPPAHDEEPA